MGQAAGGLCIKDTRLHSTPTTSGFNRPALQDRAWPLGGGPRHNPLGPLRMGLPRLTPKRAPPAPALQEPWEAQAVLTQQPGHEESAMVFKAKSPEAEGSRTPDTSTGFSDSETQGGLYHVDTGKLRPLKTDKNT